MKLPAYILFITLIIMGLFFRKNKWVSIVLLSYMWVLNALNTYTPDYHSYEAVFNGNYYGLNMDSGFTLICSLFRLIGCTYQQFRMIWAMLYVLLVGNFTFKCSKNPNFVFSMMLICPILLDISGIRSSVAYLIVLNFGLLLKKPTLYNKFWFVIGIFIGASIHISAIFYLIFLLTEIKMTRKKMAGILLGSIFLTIFVRSDLFTQIVSLIYDVTGIYAIQKWLLGGSMNTYPNLIGFLSVVVPLVGLVFLSLKEKEYILRKSMFSVSDQAPLVLDRKTILFLNNIGGLMFFLVPVIAISTEGRRLLFGTLLAYYCLTSNCFSINSTSTKMNIYSLKYASIELVLIMGTLWIYMYSYQSHDVFAALYNNMLFGG